MVMILTVVRLWFLIFDVLSSLCHHMPFSGSLQETALDPLGQMCFKMDSLMIYLHISLSPEEKMPRQGPCPIFPCVSSTCNGTWHTEHG